MRSLAVILFIASAVALANSAPSNEDTPLRELKHIPIGDASALVDPQSPQEADGGCPSSASCDRVCRSYGCRSGYCGGFMWMTCWCVC